MSEFRERLDAARKALREKWRHYEVIDFEAGARAVLQLLIEEHERYLSTNEPRSTIGPMFDAGLNTAAGEMLKSCRERLEELS